MTTTEAGRLSTEEQWSDRWEERRVESLVVDPRRPALRELHRFLRCHLPRDPSLRLLEVGCYPGKFLWYSHRFFGFRVAGLELVDWCCQHARKLLDAHEVPAEIIQGDVFDFDVRPEERWDIVASFGLIEHFTDLDAIVERHVRLLRPGGRLVLSAPNHSGIYGRILRAVDPEKHATHTRIPYEDLRDCVKRSEDLELVAGGYLGRFGFWNCGLYSYLKQQRPRLYRWLRLPLRLLEIAAQRLVPNSRWLSPNFAVLCTKRKDRDDGAT